jgi:hypothetical protein
MSTFGSVSCSRYMSQLTKAFIHHEPDDDPKQGLKNVA